MLDATTVACRVPRWAGGVSFKYQLPDILIGQIRQLFPDRRMDRVKSEVRVGSFMCLDNAHTLELPAIESLEVPEVAALELRKRGDPCTGLTALSFERKRCGYPLDDSFIISEE
jgi:hypothetical protein